MFKNAIELSNMIVYFFIEVGEHKREIQTLIVGKYSQARQDIVLV